MKLTLLLATRGRTDELYRLFRSLEEQTYQEFEVLIVDQNEDARVDPVVAAFKDNLKLQHIRSNTRGHAAANNVGLSFAQGDIIVFPDDDCWYPRETFARVLKVFQEHPEWDGLTGRETLTDNAPISSRFDSESGPVTQANIWRRHISFTMFFRRAKLEGLRYDETLGIGAGTIWGSGEETDFLLRFIESGNSVHYDPSLVVCHPDWGTGPYDSSHYRKAHAYGMGMGRVLQVHGFPAKIVLKYLIRPFVWTLVAMLGFRFSKAKYHSSIFRGRVKGWLASSRLDRSSATRGVIRNALSLYGVQACRKVLPLISIPFLARVLGPEGWGRVAVALSMGEFIVLLVEFGFNLSTTREIARNRDDPAVCGKIVSGTIGAQLCLAFLGVLGALAVSTQVPLLRDNPRLLAAGIFYGVAQGLAPIWFFQGLERMVLAAAVEISGKVLGLIGIFIFVRQIGDGWKVLALQGLPPAITTMAAMALAYRIAPFGAPTVEMIRRSLKAGWGMFLLRSGVGLYGVGNVFILGLFASPQIVGYFASAEKISKAMCGLLLPIRDSLFPRLSHLALHSPAQSARLTKIGAIAMGIGGALLTIGTFFMAPEIIHLLLGKGFEPAVNVLRILSVLPFVIALTDSIGMQWLLPRGREAIVTKVIMAGGALNVILASVLASRFLHIGMAWSVVVAEVTVCTTLLYIVYRFSRSGDVRAHEVVLGESNYLPQYDSSVGLE